MLPVRQRRIVSACCTALNPSSLNRHELSFATVSLAAFLDQSHVARHAGNNAVEMQTTAEYDHAADEFIINTPTTLAQKYWV